MPQWYTACLNRGSEHTQDSPRERAEEFNLEVHKMKYIVISNLGLIMSLLAFFGKSVWGKSVW